MRDPGIHALPTLEGEDESRHLELETFTSRGKQQDVFGMDKGTLHASLQSSCGSRTGRENGQVQAEKLRHSTLLVTHRYER